MATLQEVQAEIKRQVIRDYAQRPLRTMQNLVCLGLTEEAGEVAGLMKRRIRCNPDRADPERSTQENFKDELGDVLWYLGACCEAFDTSLEEIWEYNIQKLKERYGE